MESWMESRYNTLLASLCMNNMRSMNYRHDTESWMESRYNTLLASLCMNNMRSMSYRHDAECLASKSLLGACGINDVMQCMGFVLV